MNSKKVKNILLPIIIAITFVLVSFSVSALIPIRTWSNILLLGSMELVCIYVIVMARFSRNRQRFMVCVLSLQFVLYTIPYTMASWVGTNFNFNTADIVHDKLFLMYEPASNIVAFLLILLACWPEGLLNGLASSLRVDFYLGRVNSRLGIYLFSVDKAS